MFPPICPFFSEVVSPLRSHPHRPGSKRKLFHGIGRRDLLLSADTSHIKRTGRRVRDEI